MRSRSNSGHRLDYFNRLVNHTIIKYQHAVTGLLPGSPEHPHAWVRDNVYSILCVWGLSLAYRRNADLDEDRAKAYELEQSVVKLMRSLLRCMMTQLDKLEKFKHTQNQTDCLHAKYSVNKLKTVVGDKEWGHLQIDATSLYLLTLAQMTASGLRIIFTLDEVAFVQNLVFYIEAAYRIPDYGTWERGDKTNRGIPELNASSIGMAKAAMEAINELDLFGALGGPQSVIHVLADEPQQCQAVLQSMLPRESNSKEVDAGLLGIVGFPAFAVDDEGLIDHTVETIDEKLKGRYGFRRFLRDGYKTAKEDPNRLYYESWELKVFENIECEWPMFFCYMVLTSIFRGRKDLAIEYKECVEKIMIRSDSGLPFIPEMFAVPRDKVEAEYNDPSSQDRIPVGKMPHMWGQSLYILCRLLMENLLTPGEIDPLNRRLVTEPKPDLIVQVVILAEDDSIQDMLSFHDLHVQTFSQVAPFIIAPARFLSFLYSHLGKNEKLGLSGRFSNEIGLLSTSKLYMVGDRIYAFLPQFVDYRQFYLAMDSAMIIEIFKTEVAFLSANWQVLGRPTIIFPISSSLLEYHESVPATQAYSTSGRRTPRRSSSSSFDHTRTLPPTLLATIQKLKSGYINGTRVQLGNLIEFVSTSCVTKLTFLPQDGETEDLKLHTVMDNMGPSPRSRLPSSNPRSPVALDFQEKLTRRSSIHGIVKRTKSIAIDSEAEFAVHYLKGSRAPDKTDGSSPKLYRRRGKDASDSNEDMKRQFEGIDCAELVDMLKETEHLQDQADIIYYLLITQGKDWDTGLAGNQACTVNDLLKELYERAGHLKQWWLVRHTAGLLNKRVEDLAKAVTDLMVRQKQLTVGLPPEPREKIIIRPLPPDELAEIIHTACGEDKSTAMFTQELLVYLAMFIRTEPNLFNEMLRLRVGLIIQVMAVELARSLKCTGEEASDHLLNLSPFETKTLLHHILSGKEFGVSSVLPGRQSASAKPGDIITDYDRNRKRRESTFVQPTGLTSPDHRNVAQPKISVTADQEHELDRHGQWLRRRRLDGALNRVPVGFYPRVWSILEKCHGLNIEGHVLQECLTKEMTQGEMKFALQIEKVLNRIPQPEYRQLMVEAMMVLCLLSDQDVSKKLYFNHVIHIDRLVWEANVLFLKEQLTHNGDSMGCCAQRIQNYQPSYKRPPLVCNGSAGICNNFYDSSPSGRYGTMTYLFRAAAITLDFPQRDCTIS